MATKIGLLTIPLSVARLMFGIDAARRVIVIPNTFIDAQSVSSPHSHLCLLQEFTSKKKLYKVVPNVVPSLAQNNGTNIRCQQAVYHLQGTRHAYYQTSDALPTLPLLTPDYPHKQPPGQQTLI